MVNNLTMPVENERPCADVVVRPRWPMPSETEACAEETRSAVRHILSPGGRGGAVERRHTI